MIVTPFSPSVPSATALKPKDAAASASAAGINLAPSGNNLVSTPFSSFGDSNISDAQSARQSTNLVRGNILATPQLALKAQANLDPQTVLQLLAD